MTPRPYAQLDVAACQQLITHPRWWKNITHIAPTLGCHLWRPDHTKKNSGNSGYPEIKLLNKTRYATRIALVAALGRNPHPDTPECAHKCANSLCVNPHHLRESTHLDNMADNRHART